MSSRDRVSERTSDITNQRIENEIRKRIDYYIKHPSKIKQRLFELDKEWDIERTLEVNSSILSLVGLTMGLSRNRKWFLLPLAVQSFFLQHALQGWCPPLPLLRSLGFRTPEEIESERMALKAIRGDFEQVGGETTIGIKPNSEAVWHAVSR